MIHLEAKKNTLCRWISGGRSVVKLHMVVTGTVGLRLRELCVIVQ
jgi:hypothetical protein